MMECAKVGVSLAEKTVLHRIRPATLLEKSKRIGIPRRYVEILRQSEMVEFQGSAHEIVNDVATRRQRPQDTHLNAVKGDDLI